MSSNETAKTVVYVIGQKRKNKNGEEFTAYRTMMKLIVEGEEEKGLQNIWVDVSFSKEDRETVNKYKGRIAVTCDPTKISAPLRYNVRKDKLEDGTYRNVYPRVFIREFIEIKEAPRAVPQNQFQTDPEEVAIRKPHLQPRKSNLDETTEEPTEETN